MEHKKLFIGSIVFLLVIGLILFLVLRKKKSSSNNPPYSCHAWTVEDQQKINSGVPQQQVCENDGFIFTQGANQNYPGCGTCWCCAPN